MSNHFESQSHVILSRNWMHVKVIVFNQMWNKNRLLLYHCASSWRFSDCCASFSMHSKRIDNSSYLWNCPHGNIKDLDHLSKISQRPKFYSKHFISWFYFSFVWHINFLLSLCNAFWKPIAHRSQVMCRYRFIFHLNFEIFHSPNLGKQCTQITLQSYLPFVWRKWIEMFLSASLKRIKRRTNERPSLHVVTNLKIANNNIAVKISSFV